MLQSLREEYGKQLPEAARLPRYWTRTSNPTKLEKRRAEMAEALRVAATWAASVDSRGAEMFLDTAVVAALFPEPPLSGIGDAGYLMLCAVSAMLGASSADNAASCKAAREDHLWVTDDAAGTITKFDSSGHRLMMVCSGGVVITDEHKMAARAASCTASISSV